MTHYYDTHQESVLRIRKINAVFFNREFEFFAGSGVFSKDKVDKGTEILINNAVLPKKGKVLDLGCGYGAIGIAIACNNPGLKVWMTDVNRRAIMLAKKNCLHNEVKNAVVKQSDLFENIDGKYDAILTNPPYAAGRKVCYSFIEQSKEHINKGGVLQLVARHNKGGKVLKEKMDQVFGNVEETAKKSGFRVYSSRR